MVCYTYVYTAGRQERGPGLCRVLNTSTTNCWNGNQVVTNNDIEEFEADDILSQGNKEFCYL